MKISLTQKYNVPGPRYTSYPTVPYWNESNFSDQKWIESFQKSFSESSCSFTAKLSSSKRSWFIKLLFLFLETFDGDCYFLYFQQMSFRITDWSDLFTS